METNVPFKLVPVAGFVNGIITDSATGFFPHAMRTIVRPGAGVAKPVDAPDLKSVNL